MVDFNEEEFDEEEFDDLAVQIDELASELTTSLNDLCYGFNVRMVESGVSAVIASESAQIALATVLAASTASLIAKGKAFAEGGEGHDVDIAAEQERLHPLIYDALLDVITQTLRRELPLDNG